VYRRSLVRLPPLPSKKQPARTPPSTFLFLPIHLSKSPGPLDPIVTKNPLPGRTGESSKPAPPTMIGGFITAYQYEELLRRAIAPRRRRAVRGVICCRKPKCQHLLRASFRVFALPCPACTRDVARSANDTESCAAQCVCAGASTAYEPLVSGAGPQKILFPRSSLRRTEATILRRLLALRGGVRQPGVTSEIRCADSVLTGLVIDG
jgi:hypothetical protein